MSIDTKKLSGQLLTDLMDRFEISSESELISILQNYSARDLFNEWLEYQQLIGCTDAIIDAWERINNAIHDRRIEDHH